MQRKETSDGSTHVRTDLMFGGGRKLLRTKE